MQLSSFSIKLATIGNLALILWIILELLRVPLYFIPGSEGPAVFVTYLFGVILLGMLANVVSLILLGLHIFRGQPIPSSQLARANFAFFFLILLYYALV